MIIRNLCKSCESCDKGRPSQPKCFEGPVGWMDFQTIAGVDT